MPWKLLFFIIVLALVVTFVGLNAGNTSDISFGLHVFSDVPVFISLFAAFLLGVLVTLPATLWSSKRTRKAPKEKESAQPKKRKRHGKSIAPVAMKPDGIENQDETNTSDIEPSS